MQILIEIIEGWYKEQRKNVLAFKAMFVWFEKES